MSHPRSARFFQARTADLNAPSAVHKSSVPNPPPMLLNFTLLISSVVISDIPALSRSHSLIYDKRITVESRRFSAKKQTRGRIWVTYLRRYIECPAHVVCEKRGHKCCSPWSDWGQLELCRGVFLSRNKASIHVCVAIDVCVYDAAIKQERCDGL